MLLKKIKINRLDAGRWKRREEDAIRDEKRRREGDLTNAADEKLG